MSLPIFRPGDESIRADQMNDLVDQVRRISNISSGFGIIIQRGPGGIVISAEPLRFNKGGGDGVKHWTFKVQGFISSVAENDRFSGVRIDASGKPIDLEPIEVRVRTFPNENGDLTIAFPRVDSGRSIRIERIPMLVDEEVIPIWWAVTDYIEGCTA